MCEWLALKQLQDELQILYSVDVNYNWDMIVYADSLFSGE